MVWQGKIEFKKAVTLNGKPHGIEHEPSLPAWAASDNGRVVHAEDTGKLWLGTGAEWKELTPGGVGSHDHNDLYYTEVEVDDMFEGKNGEKQQVAWSNVLNKPSTFIPDTHTHPSDEVSYDNTLSGLSATDVKGAIDELDGVIDGIGFSANEIDYDNTSSGLAAVTVQEAIDEFGSEYEKSLPLSSIVFVDINRTDSYIENGTFTKPYKTVSSALTNLGSKKVLMLKAGTYNEDISLPANVDLISLGTSYYDGDIIIGDGINGTMTLSNLNIQGHLTVNVGNNNTCKAYNVYIFNSGYVTLTSGNFEGGIAIDTTTTNAAITINGGSFYSHGQRISATTAPVISQIDGRCILNTSEIVGSSTNPIILSQGGTLVINQSQVINSGGGLAIDLNNGATELNPNLFSDVFHVGGIDTNTSVVIIEGVVGDDPLSSAGGLNILYRKASQIGYDNSTTGMPAVHVQDAVDEVFNIASVTTIPQTTGAPVDAPTVGTARFDPSDGTLYIYDGTVWVTK